MKKRNLFLATTALAFSLTIGSLTASTQTVNAQNMTTESTSSNYLTANFYTWMFDLTMTKDDLKGVIPGGVHGIINNYDSNDYELFDGIPGLMSIRHHNWRLTGWTWSRYVNDTTYDAIVQSMKNIFPENYNAFPTDLKGYEWNRDNFDDLIVFNTIPFQKNTYDPDWHVGGIPIETAWSSEDFENNHHTILLLKKDDKISIQYVPTNVFDVGNTWNWYSDDFQ